MTQHKTNAVVPVPPMKRLRQRVQGHNNTGLFRGCGGYAAARCVSVSPIVRVFRLSLVAA